jgi:hypothetical protein
MKKGKKQKWLVKSLNKQAAAEKKSGPEVKQTKPASKTATGVRVKAARRTAEGKLIKIIFNQIGGRECLRLAAMTWKERDAYMAKPENTSLDESPFPGVKNVTCHPVHRLN